MKDRTFPSTVFRLIWRHYISSTLMGSPNIADDAAEPLEAPF